jgi:regulator of sigma E protease
MTLMVMLLSGAWIKWAQLLCALSVLVFVHELGHFLAARAFGIRVKKFYLFFDFLFPLSNVLNFSLFKFTRGGTEYGIGWFPLGGYVQIGGMVDESMDEEEMNAPPRPDDYRSKPIWQRFIVMIGGIVMNLIFGVIFSTIFLGCFQKQYLTADEFNKYGIYAYPLAQQCKLQTGDKIIAINGKKPQRMEDIMSWRILVGATITVDRQGKNLDIKLPGDLYKKISSQEFIDMGRSKVYATEVISGSNASKGGLQMNDTLLAIDSTPIQCFGQFAAMLGGPYKEKTFKLSVQRKTKVIVLNMTSDKNGKLGFQRGLSVIGSTYQAEDYTFFKALKYGSRDAFDAIIAQAVGFAKILSGQVKARESVGSVIAMSDYFPETWNWANLFRISALLSMVLAFMNFLPIPALDGGHMVLLLVERIMGRPLNIKTQEIIQTIGVVIILALLVFTMGNDILKKFGI